jgi:selenocysteine-specific elongation factor
MRTVVVGTAGHIDHGKSTLVTALTGTDPDRLKEEKARGITIELGFAHAAVAEDVMASFVDVPGHERFVRAMLAGAGGIDVVMLVVAADESVMPQTREHFDICRLLDVRRGLVAVTKIDAAEPGLADLVAAEVAELVAGSFMDGAPIVPVSARTGEGLALLRATIAEVARDLPTRPRDGVLRLPVDRAFTLRGFGTVVTGTLVSGSISVDDEVVLLPGDRRVKVRGLHVHGGPRATVGAGERVAVNLAGVEVADVARGSVVTTPGALAATRRADVRLTLLPDIALKHGARVRVHQGTAEVLARVAVAGDAGAIEAGGDADVRLRFETPAVLTRGDRLILRRYSPPATIGGGECWTHAHRDPAYARRAASRAWRLCALGPTPMPTGVRRPRCSSRRQALTVSRSARSASGSACRCSRPRRWPTPSWHRERRSGQGSGSSRRRRCTPRARRCLPVCPSSTARSRWRRAWVVRRPGCAGSPACLRRSSTRSWRGWPVPVHSWSPMCCGWRRTAWPSHRRTWR